MTDTTNTTNMKKAVMRIPALVLALIMCLGLFTACRKKEPETPEPPAPLVVAYKGFGGTFSPFFAESGGDLDVAEITGVNLLTTDRAGAVIYNAADGEAVLSDGKSYIYKGIANLSVDRDDDKTVYTWKLRQDVKFSDGQPLTADDVIFTYYTLLDPSYEGPLKLNTVDIVGLQEYRTQTSARIFNKYLALSEAIFAAGEEHVRTEDDPWSQEMQSYFWDGMRRIWLGDVQSIVDYVYANYLDYSPYYIGYSPEETTARDELRVVLGMAVWGFGSFEKETATAKADAQGKPVTDENGEFVLASEGEPGIEVKVRVRDENGNYIFTGKYTGNTWDLSNSFPTLEDYYNECYAAYEGDPVKYWNTAAVDDTDVYQTAQSAFILEWGPKDRALAGKGIPSIEGIKKLDESTVQVTTNGYSDTDIYAMDVIVAPLHYYGDKGKYDYANNKFGFDFGDISLAVSNSASPLGAGPYKLMKYESGIIYFAANEQYYKGAPKTAELRFKVMSDEEMVSGIQNGAVDIASPSFSADAVSEIKSANSNGELTGDIITTVTLDNPGYGYIGINADTVNVGGVPDGEASKNLRRAFAVLFAFYRETSIEGYYGERASVIDYPVSNSLWTPPLAGEEGYTPAFSKGLDGNPLYDDVMTPDGKYQAALAAATEYFKAAGYTWDETAGKFVLAPVGAKLEYDIIVPGYGQSDHPSFAMCMSVKEALEKIGITLIINDPSNPERLWEKINAGTQEMWCAAWEWSSMTGPDIYQIYHSSGIVGAGGSGSNYYYIQDSRLDDLIVQMKKIDNVAEKKSVYRDCLDIVSDWAVEIPVYQKHNCFIFSTPRINLYTMTDDLTAFWDWMKDIELLEMR